jgi:hypothetical protein
MKIGYVLALCWTLAACSQERPPLPDRAPVSHEKECSYLLGGMRVYDEIPPGLPKDTNFHCKYIGWQGRKAECTYDRQFFDFDGTPDSPPNHMTITMRYIGDEGWCEESRRTRDAQ